MTHSSPSHEAESIRFDDLHLPEYLLSALRKLGYENPSPIQAQAIPAMLDGQDILGQAQTGTGKTAAFALPVLADLDMRQKHPQVLVLTPTRELAIQVAEAFQRYAADLKGFHVLPIYGGQDYRLQTRPLERGVHVVVGTPGRVMDHIRRGTLKLEKIKTLVLDEADEMLRMGFIEDVEWVLEQLPEKRRIALFSATMPREVKRIAEQHLQQPVMVKIQSTTTTADTIRQRYWMVSGLHKLDALTRLLEVEPFDAMVVFVRTKLETLELAERLQARGFQATALNGDIAQKDRERTIKRLKAGQLDILVATDVAARGLDVERISHVINYDIPTDTEAYVHRIGRTGRAGRKGEAILFVSPREKRMLRLIEKATRQKIEPMQMPAVDEINDQRVARFRQKIVEALQQEDELDLYRQIIEQIRMEQDVPAAEIAAVLAKMVQGSTPLLLKDLPRHDTRRESPVRKGKYADRDHKGKRPPRREHSPPESGMERYRVEVGHEHGVKPGNIVGAIANEADLDSQYIGAIRIHDEYSTVDLPEGMPKEVQRILQKARVAGRPMKLSLLDAAGHPKKTARGKPGPKGTLSRKGGKGKPGSHR